MSTQRVLQFDLLRPLGRGGMGEVWEAFDTRLERRVALKFVADERAANALYLRYLEREARSAARLKHPHIAVIHGLHHDGDRPFLEMELLDGPTLRSMLRAGPLPVAQALQIARDAASALAYAHGAGDMMHRDVKPENIMFDAHGGLKLMDFGLAYVTGTPHLTRTGATPGTPGYMAPEVYAGQSCKASDVFALGVVLQAMFTCRLPFAGENEYEIMNSVCQQPPLPLLELRPEAGADVAALVARMLEKAPAERPGAERVVRELDRMIRSRASGDTGDETDALSALDTIPDSDPSAPEVAPYVRSPRVRDARRRRPRRPHGQIAVSALVVLGLAAWGVSALLARRTAQALRVNNDGIRALAAHDLDGAERQFLAATRTDPGFRPARLNLAVVAANRRDLTGAARRITDLLRRVPRQDRALRSLAWSHLAEIAAVDRNWSSARIHALRAFAEDSSEGRAYNLLGFAELRAGAADTARLVLARGIARFPSLPPLHKNLGLAALELGDLPAAASAAEAALALDADYAPAYALRARVRARRGEISGAEDDFRRYRALSPPAEDQLPLEADAAAFEDQLTRADLVARGLAGAAAP